MKQMYELVVQRMWHGKEQTNPCNPLHSCVLPAFIKLKKNFFNISISFGILIKYRKNEKILTNLKSSKCKLEFELL